MADTTSNLGLPLLTAAQAQKHVTHNEALGILDTVSQISVVAAQTAPPGTLTEGASYIVSAGATGAWAGHDGHIAFVFGGAWNFIVPVRGWLAYNRATDVYLRFSGSAWVAAFSATGGSYGVQDFQDTATATTPIALTSAGTWHNLTNNDLGPLGDHTTWAVPGHGPLWDTATQRFDFTDLAVGDMLHIRVDYTATTAGSNHEISARLAFGPSLAYSIPFASENHKSAGSYQRVRYFSFQIQNAEARDNPAVIQVKSDATGDHVIVAGWKIETQVV